MACGVIASWRFCKNFPAHQKNNVTTDPGILRGPSYFFISPKEPRESARLFFKVYYSFLGSSLFGSSLVSASFTSPAVASAEEGPSLPAGLPSAVVALAESAAWAAL